jgi:transposase-like protein
MTYNLKYQLIKLMIGKNPNKLRMEISNINGTMRTNFQKRQFRQNKNTWYSDEFKRTVVLDVLSGAITKDGARRLYGIKGKSAVLNWIRNYENPKPVKPQKVYDPNAKESTVIELYRLQKELQFVQLKVQELQTSNDQKRKNPNTQRKKLHYSPGSLMVFINHKTKAPRYHFRLMHWLRGLLK